MYTFNNYQHYFGPADFCLDLMVVRYDVCGFLGDRASGVPSQPLLMAMAKDIETGEYLWNLELWHEKLLPSSATD